MHRKVSGFHLIMDKITPMTSELIPQRCLNLETFIWGTKLLSGNQHCFDLIQIIVLSPRSKMRSNNYQSSLAVCLHANGDVFLFFIANCTSRGRKKDLLFISHSFISVT